MAARLREAMAADVAEPKITTLDVDRVRGWVEKLLEEKANAADLAQMLEAKTREITRIEQEVIPGLLDEVGVESMKVDGRTVGVSTLYAPHVLKINEPIFFDWLRQNDFDSIIKSEVKALFGKGEDERAAELAAQLMKQHYSVSVKQSVHPGTLKAFVKEQQERGAPLPDVLDIHRVRTTIIK
jgi:hypothetical protein